MNQHQAVQLVAVVALVGFAAGLLAGYWMGALDEYTAAVEDVANNGAS